MITAPALPASAYPFAPVWAVVERLATYAAALYTKLTAANPPATPRNPRAASKRALSAFFWLVALGTTLAGDRTYLPVARKPRAVPAAKTRARPARPYSVDDRERDERRRIRKAFATLPLGIVAERIARRLGLTEADPLWPHELAKISQTTVEYLGSRKVGGSAPEPPLGAAPPDPHPLEARTPASAPDQKWMRVWGRCPQRGPGAEPPAFPTSPPDNSARRRLLGGTSLYSVWDP
jgi:hypothetical protein